MWEEEFLNMNNQVLSNSVSDPYHLVGSGSVSGNVDMDPGSAKN